MNYIYPSPNSFFGRTQPNYHEYPYWIKISVQKTHCVIEASLMETLDNNSIHKFGDWTGYFEYELSLSDETVKKIVFLYFKTEIDVVMAKMILSEMGNHESV